MLCSSVAIILAVLVGWISTEEGNDTEFTEFIKEAKEKNFPLEYNWLDCALRGYGSFVLWMHLVVYLILKYIHREADGDAKGIVLLEEQPDTAKKAIAASAKASASTPRTARESSKKSSRSVSKKRKRSLKGSKKGKKHTFEVSYTLHLI
ncbi:unnamed protein product [Heligmosomoides polygyrus]|uniref:Transmembrane protein n=1 Tax=Heligmosomoides polygyrus TaxID=6339 RepID=A0A183G2Y1_HELPZ|nr:unnamed protein product [Heligmosomoides polygyrus]